MSMQIQTLDILIEKAHFDPQVARAIAEAIAVETNNVSTTLATKQDLAEVKSERVRWLFLVVMGQAAMMCGLMYFLLQPTR